VTDRAIFNRKYTDYTPSNTQVWVINGAGVTTIPVRSQTFVAGDNLIQGEVVYVSGTQVFPATAASGVDSFKYNAVGITTAAAGVTSGVGVNFDDIAVITPTNLVGETQMVPGQYYYLAKFDGQLTQYVTASGSVTASGGYAALVSLGLALSPTEIQLEIAPPIVLNS
jgi:hypothetical protein